MWRFLAFAVVAALVAPAAPAPAADGPSAAPAEDSYLFAAGGTNLSSGFFFPGTATCDKDGCTMFPGQEPLQVSRGGNITFANLDPSFVTNGHRVVSLKRKKKTGEPKFHSEQVDGPATATIKTSHLRPGVYYYLCTTHFGMYGAIEITES